MYTMWRSVAILWTSWLLLRCDCAVQDLNSQSLISGDVTLGAMFSVSNVKDDACGDDYDVDTLQEVLAVQWFLNALNGINYIPGVKIGLEAYRTCQSVGLATKNTVNMLQQFHVLDDASQDTNNSSLLFGLLGPGRTAEAIAVSRFLSSLPPSQRPLQISGSATGTALADRHTFPNFFRVIPPDSTQVQVLLKLLIELRWNYFAIVYDDDAYGQDAAQKLKSLAVGEGLCVASFLSLPLEYTSLKFQNAVRAVGSALNGGGGTQSAIQGVVYIGGIATANKFMELLNTQVTFARFIFSEALSLQTSVVSQSKMGKGALTAVPPYLPLPEFGAFWNSLWTNWTVYSTVVQTNAWLAGYFTLTTQSQCGTFLEQGCWLSNRDKLPIIQDSTQWFFQYYQVKAAGVMAALLKQLHTDKCAGKTGVCTALEQLIRSERQDIQTALETASFNLSAEFADVTSVFQGQSAVQFDGATGEIKTGGGSKAIYNVFNYRLCDNNEFCFMKVGGLLADGTLNLARDLLRGYDDFGTILIWPNLPRSQCMTGYDCLRCLPPDIPGMVAFLPGDLYIVGVAPVHDRVKDSPLECGSIRTGEGADFVQALLYAVGRVNAKVAPFSAILAGKRLGVLVLNSCFRELIIKDRLIELHKGTLMLPDGRNSSHILPNIAGYVGAFYSSVSVAMYEVLTNLDTRFLLLSPSNTSPELSERSKYPLFLRLTSGHDSLARAILSLVNKLGHQFIQVVYDPEDIYTSSMKDTINALSASYNVCVVSTISSDAEAQSYYSVLDSLRRNVWAPIVLTLLQKTHLKNVLDDVLPSLTSSDQFLFLGTDAWARDLSLLSGASRAKLQGSLTFSVELPLNQLFAQDISNTDPLNSTNPWLKYFWEAKKYCYFDGSFRRRYRPNPCPQDLTSDYVQSSWLPFYIQAVYALALGLDDAMANKCGQASLCEALKGSDLVESTRAVRLDLYNSGQRVRVFNDNGDGEAGYKLFQISPDTATANTDDLTYEEVGRYEHDQLTVDLSRLWVLKNTEVPRCPNPTACNACFPPTTASPQSAEDTGGLEGGLVAAIVIIVILLIVIVVIVILFVLKYRRLKTKRDQREKLAFDNMGSNSEDSGLSSRPLPPINGGASDSGSVITRETTMSPNHYDYLDRPEHPNPSPTHPYNHPPAANPSPRPASYVPLDSAGYVTRTSSEGRPPAAGYDHAGRFSPRNSQDVQDPVSYNPGEGSSGSGSTVQLPLSAHRGGSISGGGSGGGGGASPIRFENPDGTLSTEGSASDGSALPGPDRAHGVRESGYLTAVAEAAVNREDVEDYLDPVPNYLAMT